MQLLVMPAWLKSTLRQLTELWHVPQSACVGMWDPDRPWAIEPLWHERQGASTSRCSNLAACHVAVVWQSSQLDPVGTWFRGFVVSASEALGP